MTCPPTEGTTLALTKLYFGEGTSGEWKSVGMNIDGLVSTAASTDLCKPNSNATPDVPYPDGDNGIDNSFGKNILPFILGVYPQWSTDVNNGILNGSFNALLKMYCIPPTGDAPQLTTKFFGGTELGSMPKFDGTDIWPVAPELLSNPTDPESSTIVFDKSSIMGATYDSGKGQLILTIPLQFDPTQDPIKLTLYAARVTMTLSADRKSATAGTIAGVLNTEEAVIEAKKVAAVFSQKVGANLCDPMYLDPIVTGVRQASDIMTDGTQDPTKTCDGISIGIQFEMKEVQIGSVGPPTPAATPCP